MKKNEGVGIPQPLKKSNVLSNKNYSSSFINVSLCFDILILKILPVSKKGDQ